MANVPERTPSPDGLPTRKTSDIPAGSAEKSPAGLSKWRNRLLVLLGGGAIGVTATAVYQHHQSERIRSAAQDETIANDSRLLTEARHYLSTVEQPVAEALMRDAGITLEDVEPTLAQMRSNVPGTQTDPDLRWSCVLQALTRDSRGGRSSRLVDDLGGIRALVIGNNRLSVEERAEDFAARKKRIEAALKAAHIEPANFEGRQGGNAVPHNGRRIGEAKDNDIILE